VNSASPLRGRAAGARTDCELEPDVLDALRTGRWPARADEALREHVATCHVCADLITVAQGLLADGEAALDEAVVPRAGVVYLRAQRRAREEAARIASWPTLAVQALALACAAGLLLALAGPVSGWAASSIAWIDVGWPAWPALTLSDLRDASPIVRTGLLVAGLAGIVLGPVAIYLAAAHD
jgi:predicted anti-sigma-YlaC factor YlaD